MSNVWCVGNPKAGYMHHWKYNKNTFWRVRWCCDGSAWACIMVIQYCVHNIDSIFSSTSWPLSPVVPPNILWTSTPVSCLLPITRGMPLLFLVEDPVCLLIKDSCLPSLIGVPVCLFMEHSCPGHGEDMAAGLHAWKWDVIAYHGCYLWVHMVALYRSWPAQSAKRVEVPFLPELVMSLLQKFSCLVLVMYSRWLLIFIANDIVKEIQSLFCGIA